MSNKETYKVEISEIGLDDEEVIYRRIKSFSKGVFDNITKITLVGVVAQVANIADSKSIAYFVFALFLLVSVNIALDLYFLVKSFRPYVLSKKLGKLANLSIFVFFFVLVVCVYQFFIMPAVAEVFAYYASQTSK